MTSVRRVRRIIRKIDPWTTLKVSLVVYTVMGVALVLGGVILWAVVQNAGIPESIDDLLLKVSIFDNESDTIIGSGERYFLLAVFLGVVWAVIMTGFTTLGAVMYNLVADVVGGLEVVVLEEVLGQPPASGVRQARQWTNGERPAGSRRSRPKRDRNVDLPTETTTPAVDPSKTPEEAAAEATQTAAAADEVATEAAKSAT